MNCLRRAAAFALALQMRLLQSFASPACIGWSDIADQLWDAGRSPLLASLHFLASSFGTIGWLRSESPGLLIPVSLLQGIACSLAHGAAWGKLLGAKRRHTSNLLCCLAWVCRCSMHLCWAYGANRTQLIVYNGFRCGTVPVAEIIVNGCLEQVNAFLLLPFPVVSIAAIIHLRIAWAAMQLENIHYSLLATCVWWASQLSAPYPYLVLYYLKRQASLKASATTKQVAGAAAASGYSDQPGVRSSRLHDKVSQAAQDLAVISELQRRSTSMVTAGSQYPVIEEQSRPLSAHPSHTSSSSQSQSGAGAAFDTTCDHMPAHDSASPPQPQHGPYPTQNKASPAPAVPCDSHDLNTVLSCRVASGHISHDSSAPEPRVLQGLHNVKQLVRSMHTSHAYQSRLLRSKVVIKLAATHPEDLAPDVMGASNSVMRQATGHAGIEIIHGCALRGCTLLVFDLVDIQPSTGASSSRSLSQSDSDHLARTLQAWLPALLAPGTPVPDGAVARIAVGSHQFEARWSQHKGSWTCHEAPLAEPPPVRITLLQATNLITRLLSFGTASTQGGDAADSCTQALHRVSLLLTLQHTAGTSADALFLGSDTSGSAPEVPSHGADGQAVTVQCVARGPYGTCLPVTVTARTSSPAGQVGSSDVAELLAQVDVYVDLSSASHAGAVQLELWQGHTLAASVPLLLLPVWQNTKGSGPDDLLDELSSNFGQLSQVQVQGCGDMDAQQANSVWGVGRPTGVTGFLTDLGQLLTVGDCITSQALSSTTGPGRGHAIEGPGAWGGIAASTARSLSTDTDLLSGMTVLAEGLQEYAADEGVRSTSELIRALGASVKHSLGQLGHRHVDPAGMTACASVEPKQRTGSGGGHGLQSSNLRHRPGVSRGSGQEPGSIRSFDQGIISSSCSDVKAAAPHQPRHHASLISCPSFTQAALAMLTGFQSPQDEEGYRSWVAVSHSTQVRAFSLVYLFWVATCVLRSGLQGWGVLRAELPTHLLIGAPYLASVLMAGKVHHRWLEPLLLSRSLLLMTSCWLCVVGTLTFPSSYSLLWRIRMDLWIPALLHTPFTPMRVWYLLPSLGFSAAGAVAVTKSVVGWQEPWLLRVILPRVTALGLGMLLDTLRRMAFLRQQAPSPPAVPQCTCQ